MERPFKGIWIPAEIWLDEKLTVMEKVLYAEIDSFCSKGRECFCSNAHFAKVLQVSERQVIRLINSLEEKGVISRRLVYKGDSKEVDKRYLKAIRPAPFDTTPTDIDVTTPTDETVTTPLDNIDTTPGEENVMDTNTVFTNPIITNTEEIDIRNSEGVATVAPYQKIVELYHATCTSLPKIRNPAALSESRKKAIKARWCEWNRSLDNFRECFTKVEASDFLSGRNGKWSNCGFDWIMKQSSFTKIMEGNYDNKAHGRNDQPSQIVDSDVDWSKYDG